MLDTASLAIEAAAKALLYLALLPALGACGLRWVLLTGLDRDDESVGSLERRAARIGSLAALVVLGALAIRAWAHTAAAFGWAESLRWESLRVVALESRWGSAWRVQVMAASAFVASYAAIGLHRRTGWVLASLAGLGCCFAVPLLGHAAGSPGRQVVHAAHLIGAGAWVGTLAAVLFLPSAELSKAPARSSVEAPATGVLLLRQFAPLALVGATSVVAAGLMAAWFYLTSVADLWTTIYGRVLFLKILVVSGVALCGYRNWRRFGRPDGARSSLGLARVEVSLAATAVLATSVLSELSPE